MGFWFVVIWDFPSACSCAELDCYNMPPVAAVLLRRPQALQPETLEGNDKGTKPKKPVPARVFHLARTGFPLWATLGLNMFPRP